MRRYFRRCHQLKLLSNNKQTYLSATVAGQNRFILNLQKKHWLISDAGFFFSHHIISADNFKNKLINLSKTPF